MIRVDVVMTRGTMKQNDLAIIDGQRMIISLFVERLATKVKGCHVLWKDGLSTNICQQKGLVSFISNVIFWLWIIFPLFWACFTRWAEDRSVAIPVV
jgi:hypothetical protein